MSEVAEGSQIDEVGENRAAESSGSDCEQRTANIVEHLEANRANTLALCACLWTCLSKMPYREAEDLIAARPELALSMQSAHALVDILLACGGIEAFEVPEDACSADDERQDMPVGYLLQTTEAGKQALARFEPAARFDKLLESEPKRYAQAFSIVLRTCLDGASKAEVELALEGNEALSDPKEILPSYFLSKLETVGGLTWDGSWKTTQDGQRMLVLIG